MCAPLNKTLAAFELGYAAEPGSSNPFDIRNDNWRCWMLGYQCRDEERAQAERERYEEEAWWRAGEE